MNGHIFASITPNDDASVFTFAVVKFAFSHFLRRQEA